MSQRFEYQSLRDGARPELSLVKFVEDSLAGLRLDRFEFLLGCSPRLIQGHSSAGQQLFNRARSFLRSRPGINSAET